MRVTAERKRETRRTILQSALELFEHKGFEQTTTRHIAASADLAVGTLFNYFPSKEAIAVDLVVTALSGLESSEDRAPRGDESLEESLFAFIMAGLARAERRRSLVATALPVLSEPSVANSFFAADGEVETPARSFQRRHLDAVVALLRRHGAPMTVESDAILLHLYWSLYLGALSFWASDQSPGCEDTLAVVDRLTRVFARAALTDQRQERPPEHENGIESKGGVE
ncbi:MAG: TetR/AcrR family transcriptional regulator [Phycisphaerales bacterium]